MSLAVTVTPVDNTQLDRANARLKGQIPDGFYAQTARNFPSYTNDRLKPVKVAAEYIQELKSKLKGHRRATRELKHYHEAQMEGFKATLMERGETIKEKEAHLDRVLMNVFQGLVEDMGASENSKLQAQYEAKVKEVKALKQQVEELQDLLMGIDPA